MWDLTHTVYIYTHTIDSISDNTTLHFKKVSMGRSPCCVKEGLNRGAWTSSEDKILTDYINLHGEGKWRNLPKRAGLKRCGKSCRLRWLNYLRPDIKRGNISRDEEELIIRLHKLLGNRWSLIAGRLPGRTDNEIKNYWNTNIGKKIQNGRQNSKKCQNKNNFVSKKYLDNCQPIRTKARRCTKVVIDHFPEGQKREVEIPEVKKVIVQSDSDLGSGSGNVVDELGSFPEFEFGESRVNDFMEFEMNRNFLSEFLNHGFEKLDSSSGITVEKSFSSSDTDWVENKIQDSDFSFMDSIIGSEFGWMGEEE